VFLNGCQSAQMVEGLTRAFLRAGSRLVLGLCSTPRVGEPQRSRRPSMMFFSPASRLAKQFGRRARPSKVGATPPGPASLCTVIRGSPSGSILCRRS
jgi:hypothetical protein